jgi:hypothetical protein
MLKLKDVMFADPEVYQFNPYVSAILLAFGIMGGLAMLNMRMS